MIHFDHILLFSFLFHLKMMNFLNPLPYSPKLLSFQLIKVFLLYFSFMIPLFFIARDSPQLFDLQHVQLFYFLHSLKMIHFLDLRLTFS